jgi:hypothetical protein
MYARASALAVVNHMYTLTNLSSKIADIQNNNLSGVLMVSGQSLASQNKTLTYSLRFESGDIARVGGSTEIQGINAVIELVQLHNLAEPRWFPLNPTPNWAGNAQISRHEISGLFGLANVPSTAPVKVAVGPTAATANSDQAGKALLQRVRTVFRNVYIGDTDTDLAHVAKLHPPSSEPTAFIDACVHLLEPMLGEDAAHALLTAASK